MAYRTKYFTEEEMTFSETAWKARIPNKPNEEEMEHLKELMAVLDEFREGWGGPIRVNSGFRCKKVNTLVGGSKTSVHMKGWAADLYPLNNRFNDFVAYAKLWAKAHQFDQLLIETNSRGSRWLHLGLHSNAGEQRHQIKNMTVK